VAYALVFGVLTLLLAWLLLGGRDAAPEPTADRRVGGDIDYATLEDAEREVREAPDESAVRDWGPGAGRAGPPVA
jgi:hypothetical protein